MTRGLGNIWQGLFFAPSFTTRWVCLWRSALFLDHWLKNTEFLTSNLTCGDDTRAIHAKLKPIVDTPILLRPLPTFDAYFDADSSHR